MPVITATRAGTCTAAGCGGRIRKGELCWFESSIGTRHLEGDCREADAGARPNRTATSCVRCGRRVGAGQGYLRVTEQGTRKTYTVTCAVACGPGRQRSTNRGS